MARTGPAITRRKDRYQLRAASASQPETLKTYACAQIVLRDVAPGAVAAVRESAYGSKQQRYSDHLVGAGEKRVRHG